MLDAGDGDLPVFKVELTQYEPRGLRDSQAVEVDQSEQQPVTCVGWRDGLEEALDLLPVEVANLPILGADGGLVLAASHVVLLDDLPSVRTGSVSSPPVAS